MALNARTLIPAVLLMGCATPAAVLSTTTDAPSPVATRTEEPTATLALATREPLDPISAEARAELMRSGVIYFTLDSADLLPESRQQLSAVAEKHLKTSRTAATLEGHADERGTEEYNLVLGQTRAASVQKYLERLGVPAERLSTRSYGEARPAVPGHGEAAWAQNRRVQIVPTELPDTH